MQQGDPQSGLMAEDVSEGGGGVAKRAKICTVNQRRGRDRHLQGTIIGTVHDNVTGLPKTTHVLGSDRKHLHTVRKNNSRCVCKFLIV